MEILLVGNSIQIKPAPGGQPEFIPVANITNVAGIFVDLTAITDPVASDLINANKFEKLAQITIHIVGRTKFIFNLQDVTNQGTWAATQAGLNIALTDINAFI